MSRRHCHRRGSYRMVSYWRLCNVAQSIWMGALALFIIFPHDSTDVVLQPTSNATLSRHVSGRRQGVTDEMCRDVGSNLDLPLLPGCGRSATSTVRALWPQKAPRQPGIVHAAYSAVQHYFCAAVLLMLWHSRLQSSQHQRHITWWEVS